LVKRQTEVITAVAECTGFLDTALAMYSLYTKSSQIKYEFNEEDRRLIGAHTIWELKTGDSTVVTVSNSNSVYDR